MAAITNIALTGTASRAIGQHVSRISLTPDEVFAVYYAASFTNKDGTPVDGFLPGYMVGPWPSKLLSPKWLVVRLGGREFNLMPRFEWNASDKYLMDLISEPYGLFSIQPQR